MRKLFAALGVLAVVAGPAAAQGTYNCPDALQSIRNDGGQGGFAFKTGNPSGPSDWFGVDFNNTLQSCKIVALCVSVSDIGNPNKNANIGKIGIYCDHLGVDPAGNTPDVGNPLAEAGTGSAANGAGCNTEFYFLIPTVHIGGDKNVHVAYNHSSGDSALFVCSDGVSPASGTSNLSTNGYSTPALGPLGIDWKMGLGIVPKANAAGQDFFINGSTAAIVPQAGRVAVSFYGPEGSNSGFTAVMGFCLCFGGVPSTFVAPPLPIGLNGVTPDSTTICGSISCNTNPTPFPIPLCTMYLDSTDTKPNGKSKLKFSDTATIEVLADPLGCGICYGQLDDGGVGLGAWSVQSPTAGSNDWFNVNHGSTAAIGGGVTTLTGVEVATVEGCGTVGNIHGGWAQVGLYLPDTAQDPSGGTPNIATPAATVSPGPVTNGVLQWGYPGSFYNTPDIAVGSTTVYHAAVKWSTADSCLFVTADDSTSVGPDPCGTIPSSTSFSTSDGYATNAANFPIVNWLLKIDWK